MAKREPWNPLLKSYPESVKINRCSFGAETMYTRLLAKCDDHGHYDGDPAMLLAGLFRRRMASKEMNVTNAARFRDELVTHGLIALYEIDGETYLEILNRKGFRRKDVKEDVYFPDPPQPLISQAVPVSVTDTLRTRNECGPLHNTIQYNTTQQEDSCPELQAASEPKPAKPPKIFWSPETSWEHITAKHRKIWTKGFPALDLDRQFAKAEAWLHANPKKAHKSNWEKFLNNWLSREQDKGGDIGVGNRPANNNAAEQIERIRNAENGR